MLRIAQFTDTFLPIVDGVGRVVHAYATTLAEFGNQVTVVAPMYNTGHRGGYPFELVDYTAVDVPGLKQYRTGEAPFDPHYLKRIRMIDIDILHAHSPFTAGSEALRLAAKRNLPLVGTLHSQYRDDFLKVTKSNQVANLGTKFVVDFYERCDEVWAVGEKTASVLYSYGYRGQVIVMPNGTNIRPIRTEDRDLAVRQFEIPEDKTLLLFVGQMNWKKNILTVLEACQVLDRQGYDFQLLLAGMGPDQRKIEAKIAEFGLGNRARLIGHITDTALLDGLYQRAQLFMFPSKYDAAPMVVREAAVMRTPSVMVEGSCAAEVIEEGVNGFLCKDDGADLARVVLSACSDRSKLQEVGLKASSTIPIRWSEVLLAAQTRYERLVEMNRQGLCKKKTRRVI